MGKAAGTARRTGAAQEVAPTAPCSTRYLLQSVQGIVQLPLALQGQQPDLLPAGRELVDAGVLGFRLGDDGHGGRGGLGQGFSWGKKKVETVNAPSEVVPMG